MGVPVLVAALLANPWFTDGVTNIIKNLGPALSVKYTYNTSATTTDSKTVYFTALCDNTPANNNGVNCLPVLYDYTQTNPWINNPTTTFTSEMQPVYQFQTGNLKDGVSNAALVGSVLGQLLFGFAGDMFGRKWSFVLTAMLIILGCLGSATAAAGFAVPNCSPVHLGPFTGFGSANCEPENTMENVYFQLMAWRFLLGLGVGGEYPLASTITSESTTRATRGRAVLWIFSMQGWGKLTAAIMNYGLVATVSSFGGPWALDGTWRFALGFGCALNILTIYFRWHLTESKIYTDTKAKEAGGDSTKAPPPVVVVASPLSATSSSSSLSALASPVAVSGEDTPITAAITPSLGLRKSLRVLWEFKYVLIGTASTWFLMDVTFYGQSLMNTTVVNSAVVSTDGLDPITKLRDSLLATIWIMCIALPGYWLAIALIERMGRYWMTQMGFAMCALWFAVLSGGYNGTTGLGNTSAASGGFVVVYGLTYFFSNFGPNATTFLMAGEAFPTRIRSTAHGISAACGKIGAAVGSSVLLIIFNSYCTQSKNGTPVGTPTCSVGNSVQSQIASGIVTVMAVCAGVSVAGNIMTTLFVKETGHRELEEVDASSKVLAEGGGAGGEEHTEHTGLVGALKQQRVAAQDWAPALLTQQLDPGAAAAAAGAPGSSGATLIRA